MADTPTVEELQAIDNEVPKQIPWDIWMKLMDEQRRPGWAYGRLALCSERDSALFMFGWLRGSFGVFSREGTLFHDHADPMRHVFAHIVHLRTGKVTATFLNAQEAMEGCEIAEHMGDWNAITNDMSPEYKLAADRTTVGWSYAALFAQPTMAARAGDGTLVQVIIAKSPEYLNMGRPEKTS